MEFINRCTASVTAFTAILLAVCGTAAGETTTPRVRSLADLPDDPPVRVLVIERATSITVTPVQPWCILKSTDAPQTDLKPGTTVTIGIQDGEFRLLGTTPADTTSLGRTPLVLDSETENAHLLIHKVPVGVGWWWESAENRVYEGRIELHPTGDGHLSVIVELPLERYLRGVAPSEIGADSPLAALSAQAVAARSAAVLALTTAIYSGPNYDICGDVACQVFSGVGKSTAVSDEAITSTRGMILAFEGRPLSAYYASNCGGHTEDIRNVWPDRANDRGYWGAARFDGETTDTAATRPDLSTEEGLRQWLELSPPAFCNPAHAKIPTWAAGNFRWTREITADELTSRVTLLKDIGRVTAIRPVKRGPSGRMIEAEFVGEKGSLKVSPELAIRQVWQPPLRSAAFVVDPQGPEDGPEKFVIRGAGWGHGVGMCQSGAIGMANMGKNVREILAHYFPNATVEKLY